MILERRPTDYAQRNLLLQVTLGLLAGAEHLDELLARHAPPRAGAPGELEPATWAILGLIAFGERLRQALAEVPQPAPEAAPAPLAESADLTELLR